MFTDDSRNLESLDRSGASTSITRVRTDGGRPTRPIRERLESIDHLTRTLLVDIQQVTTTELADVDDETRQKAARHIREVRAEVSHAGLALFGPASSIPYRPPENSEHGIPSTDRQGSIVTTYSGPAPGAFEHERKRQCKRDGPNTDKPDSERSDDECDCNEQTDDSQVDNDERADNYRNDERNIREQGDHDE